MFLKAGLLSLALLLASRVLGLVRESAQAAAFGASGMADVAVLMLTLPDWITGVAVSGALAYVLVPAWAGQTQRSVAKHQRKVALCLLGGGVIVALVLVALREPVQVVMAAGLPGTLTQQARQGLVWSAAALPLALLATLWATRLQSQRDFVGLYGANLVINIVLVGAIALAAGSTETQYTLQWLGGGMLAAMLARLCWQRIRLARVTATEVGGACTPDPVAAAGLAVPGPSVWTWAVLAAGLPLALPVIARSAAAGEGAGGLAVFNYAWKLVELPLVLAIQLVATLAFPHVASAVKADVRSPATARAVRTALALAWTLGCAAAAALAVAAPAVVQVLFGWGRMDETGLQRIAAWGSVAAWGLLPQAVTAVALTVLATQGRLRPVVGAYGIGVLALLLAAFLGLHDGTRLMWVLNAVYAGVAVIAWLSLGGPARAWLPARALAVPVFALLAVRALAHVIAPAFAASLALELAAALGAVVLVLGSGWLARVEFRGVPPA